jgi:uncharacterized membrane protein (DUF106 family)
MIKNSAKTIILILSLTLSFNSFGAESLSEIKKELNEVKAKLRSAEGANKERLMKRMAKLENKLTESSSADRKRSK